MPLTSPSELELVDVSKHFGGVSAVSGVSIGFDKGKVTCIIGPNGAGKTTVFNLVSGALRSDAGEILYGGIPLNGLKPHLIARMGVGRLFQDVRVFDKMTPIENVCVAAKAQQGENPLWAPIWPLVGGRAETANRRRALEHLAFVGLAAVNDSPAEELSYGQQKLVAIARLLNNEASCFLLDEPAAGVHPTMVDEIMQIIRKLASKGHTVVVIEHDLGIVEEIGDWVYLMDGGRVEAFGTASDMLRDASLKRLMPVR